jgi:hypothetical protein
VHYHVSIYARHIRCNARYGAHVSRQLLCKLPRQQRECCSAHNLYLGGETRMQMRTITQVQHCNVGRLRDWTDCQTLHDKSCRWNVRPRKVKVYMYRENDIQHAVDTKSTATKCRLHHGVSGVTEHDKLHTAPRAPPLVPSLALSTFHACVCVCELYTHACACASCIHTYTHACTHIQSHTHTHTCIHAQASHAHAYTCACRTTAHSFGVKASPRSRHTLSSTLLTRLNLRNWGV